MSARPCTAEEGCPYWGGYRVLSDSPLCSKHYQQWLKSDEYRAYKQHKQQKKAAETELRERELLARLKAKYEPWTAP